jgi:hypothetical protein
MVQLPGVVWSMVLGTTHETVPATIPASSIRWKQLQINITIAVKRLTVYMQNK